MSSPTYRFSVALAAALLALSILAVPAGATHVAGLPDNPVDCVTDPLNCVNGIGSGVGGTVGGTVGGVLPGVGGGLPGVGGGLPGTGGGLPPGPGDSLGGGPPGGVTTPTAPSGPVDSAPDTAPPAVEEAPDSKPAQSRPEGSPKTISPSAERVIVEPSRGRTTIGNATNGSLSGKESRARGPHADRFGGFALDGSGPLPPSAGGSASDAAGSSSPKKHGFTAFASGLIHRIPEQYRWPVFVLACLATFFALNTLRELFRSSRAEGRALTDSLTNLPNRLAFERALAREYRRADRYDRPLSMLLLDLDGFKEINDTQGHAAGDEILRKASAVLANRVRLDDMAARLGGDEFVVICPETSADSAQDLARSLEDALAEASIQSSIGVAEREPEDDGLPEYLVARADAAMYRRKSRSGGGHDRRSAAAVAVAELAAA